MRTRLVEKKYQEDPIALRMLREKFIPGKRYQEAKWNIPKGVLSIIKKNGIDINKDFDRYLRGTVALLRFLGFPSNVSYRAANALAKFVGQDGEETKEEIREILSFFYDPDILNEDESFRFLLHTAFADLPRKGRKKKQFDADEYHVFVEEIISFTKRYFPEFPGTQFLYIVLFSALFPFYTGIFPDRDDTIELYVEHDDPIVLSLVSALPFLEQHNLVDIRTKISGQRVYVVADLSRIKRI